MILWNSYPTQIPSQSCNLGSRRKSRTDQLPVSSVYYESVPMPCVILIFFFFFHLIRQHIKESDCAGEVCALSREGSVPAEMLPALSSTKVTANLSPCAVPPPTTHAIQFYQFYMAEHLIFLAEPAVAGTLQQPCLGRVLQERQHTPAWGPAHAVNKPMSHPVEVTGNQIISWKQPELSAATPCSSVHS